MGTGGWFTAWRARPLGAKLRLYGGVIYLCGTLLPWTGAGELARNGWHEPPAVLAAHALVLFFAAAELVRPRRPGALQRLQAWSWPVVFAAVLLRVRPEVSGGLGLLLALLGLAIQAPGLYRRRA